MNGESLVSGWSESLDSITNHLAKLQFQSPSVSESSDTRHDLLCYCLVADDVEFLVVMVSTVSAHTRHGVPTRGERAQVPGTLPWWVRDCDSKVTGKVSVGHAGLRSPIVICPPGPANLRRYVRPAAGPDKNFRLGSSLRAKVVC